MSAETSSPAKRLPRVSGLVMDRLLANNGPSLYHKQTHSTTETDTDKVGNLRITGGSDCNAREMPHRAAPCLWPGYRSANMFHLPIIGGLLTLAHQVHPPSQTHSHTVNPTLLMVAIMWGSGNVVTKWVLEVLEPTAFIALRAGVIAVLMIALLCIVPRQRLATSDWLMLIVFGGGLVAAQLLSFTHAMKMTTASEGSLLISTAPVWTAVMVGMLGMELVTRLNWLGIAVASAGVVMIVFGAANGIVGNAPARLPGDLLMVGSAWLYGGYMVISKKWMQRFGELQVICCTFASGGILLAVLGAPQLLATDWTGIMPGRWLGIAYLTLLAGFPGLLLWYRTISRTSASGTAVYQYLVPGVSVVCAAIFLRERIAALQLVGIAVALVGVYLARVLPSSGAAGVKGDNCARAG